MAKTSVLTQENLKQLGNLQKKIGKKYFWIVYGGFALDGLLGKLTRSHKDIDLMFFRKDLPKIKKALKSLGIQTKEISHPKEIDLIYKIVSTDRLKRITGHILDEKPPDNFEISFYSRAHQKFPKKTLTQQIVTLKEASYPVPSKKFLLTLKKLEDKFLERIRKERPKKYSQWQKRHRLIKKEIRRLIELA